MASGSNIVIRLVTGFASKGLDLFRASMTNTGKLVTKSVAAMATAFGSLVSSGNDAAGELMKSFGQLGTMIAQGGVWGAMTFGVTKLFETIKERLDAGKRQLEGFAEAFKSSMTRAVEAAEAKFKRFTDGLARAIALSQNLLGARKAGDSADSSAAVAGVNAKERDALAKAASDSERAVISANAALERAKIRAAESTRAATGDLAEADSAVVQAQKAIAAAEDAVAEARRNYDKATRHRIAVLQSEDRTAQSEAAADESYAKAKDAHQKATDALAKARDDARLAEVAHATAQAAARKAETEASDQVAAAEFALAEAKRKAAEEEAEAKRVLEAGIKAEQDRLDAEGALRETYENLADQAKAKGKRQIQEMQKLNASIFRLKTRFDDAKSGIGRTNRGQAADAAHRNGIFGMYQYGGRANGGESFTDWSRADRFAGRADRDAAKAARRDAAAQKRFDRIRDRLENGESVSGSDEKFYDRFKAFQDQKGNAEKLEKSLESAQQKRDELQKEMQKTLEEINQNIKDALAVG